MKTSKFEQNNYRLLQFGIKYPYKFGIGFYNFEQRVLGTALVSKYELLGLKVNGS